MIPIIGAQKTSLIDFPNKISTIFFTSGCNFRCPFCHNPELVVGENNFSTIPWSRIRVHLEKRQKVLDGIVITGGEPTIYDRELIDFLQKIKEMNLLIKLDTNGTNPELLNNLILDQLVDYIAMDIKTSLKKYPSLTGYENRDKIAESVQLLKAQARKGNIELEFRTTLHPSLHDKKTFIKILELIEDAPLYALQTFKNDKTLNADYQNTHPFTDNQMKNFYNLSKQYVNKSLIR